MKYKLVKDLFGLKASGSEFIAKKSPNGYTMKLHDGKGAWIGFPAYIVENNPEWFEKIVEIRPCPFCGHDEYEIQNDLSAIRVWCKKCGATGEKCFNRYPAIQNWNQRAL